jgi:hypothetical protein
MTTSVGFAFRSPVVKGVSIAALALTLLLALLLAGAQPALAQNPEESHCGNETGGGPLSGFMSHAEVGQALRQIERTSQGRVAVEVAGHTNLGREIWAARVGDGDQVVLVQSAIHGNEQHGTRGLLNLVATIGGSSARAAQIREEITLVAIPNLNADGAAIPRRQNVMPWSDVMALHPQLADQPRAWYYSNGLQGFDVNRDFNPDLDYEPSSADLPGSSTGKGFSSRRRPARCARCTAASRTSSAAWTCSWICTARRPATAMGCRPR